MSLTPVLGIGPTVFLLGTAFFFLGFSWFLDKLVRRSIPTIVFKYFSVVFCLLIVLVAARVQTLQAVENNETSVTQAYPTGAAVSIIRTFETFELALTTFIIFFILFFVSMCFLDVVAHIRDVKKLKQMNALEDF